MSRTNATARMDALEAAVAAQNALLERLAAHVTGAPVTPAKSVATPAPRPAPAPAPDGPELVFGPTMFTFSGWGTDKNGKPFAKYAVNIPGFRPGNLCLWPQT